MVAPHHEHEWPDKVLFAALLLVVAGLLGALFAGLRIAGASIEVGGLVIFEAFGAAWILTFSSATVVLGLLGMRHQAWAWCAGGIVTAVLSMGFFGLVPLVGLAAAVMLVRGALEGEEMKHDEHTVPATAWPDKAMIASLLFTMLGLAALMQAILVFADRYSAPYLDGSPAVLGALALAVAAACLFAARQCFHQRTEWVAWIAAGLGLALAPFWIIGPVLAIGAMVFLGLAVREDEFETPTTA